MSDPPADFCPPWPNGRRLEARRREGGSARDHHSPPTHRFRLRASSYGG